MARYEHLPIYKQALDAAVHFEQVVAGFSRYHKYTLGSEIRNQSLAVLGLIVRANGVGDRAPVLLELRQRLDELLILLRLAKEVRAFRNGSVRSGLRLSFKRRTRKSRLTDNREQGADANLGMVRDDDGTCALAVGPLHHDVATPPAHLGEAVS
jgi:hypothetical protein